MKVKCFILLISLIVVSCKTPNEKTDFDYRDSIQKGNLKELIFLRYQLDSIIPADSLMHIQLVQYKKQVDSLINKSLDQKETLIQSKYLQIKIESVKKYERYVIRKNDSLKSRSEVLELQLNISNKALKDEKISNNTIYSKNVQLQAKLDKATTVFLTGLDVKGVGISTNVFGKTKEYYTNQASKVKKIEVSFFFPYNPVAVIGKRDVSVFIYSVTHDDFVQKDTIVSYEGIEKKIVVFLKAKDVKRGSHQLDVLINSRLQTQTNLVLN